MAIQHHNTKLLVFAAPSGAGKTTIVKHLLQTFPEQLAFSVSATTRPQRDNEQHGKDYYFISTAAFKQHIAAGNFLEYEEVYQGKFYGTLFSEIDRLTNAGKAVLFDIDVQGALNIKKQFHEKALLIFVKPPDLATLIQRLRNRNTETEADLQKRIAKAETELTFEKHFDVTVVNNNLENALQEAEHIVQQFLVK